MKRIKIGEYVVNSSTMYIEPVKYGDKVYSRIVETNNELFSPFKPLHNIKHSCEYFGVHFESRRKGTKLLIDYSRRLPIVIEPITGIYAFCIGSHEDEMSYWFMLNQIKNYHRVSAKETMVIFHNNQSRTFPISYYTFNTLMSRATCLQMRLMQRVEINKKKEFYFLHGPRSSKASESSEFYLKDPK